MRQWESVIRGEAVRTVLGKPSSLRGGEHSVVTKTAAAVVPGLICSAVVGKHLPSRNEDKHNPRKFQLYLSRAQGDHTARKTSVMRLAGVITHCHQQTSWSPQGRRQGPPNQNAARTTLPSTRQTGYEGSRQEQAQPYAILSASKPGCVV